MLSEAGEMDHIRCLRCREGAVLGLWLPAPEALFLGPFGRAVDALSVFPSWLSQESSVPLVLAAPRTRVHHRERRDRRSHVGGLRSQLVSGWHDR